MPINQHLLANSQHFFWLIAVDASQQAGFSVAQRLLGFAMLSPTYI
jgi:hypothetical protein